MFQYDENGNKVPMSREGYQPQKRVRFTNSVENYGSDSKCPKWLWILLYVLAGVILIVLVVVLVKSWMKNKKSRAGFGMGKKQRFGFRFY